MTVIGLMELLESTKFYGNNRVVIEGYEGGLEDITKEQISVIKIKLDENEGIDVFGPHEEVTDRDIEKYKMEYDCEAVVIRRQPL